MSLDEERDMDPEAKTLSELMGLLLPEEDPFYDRFSPRRKNLFVVIIALAGFLSPSSSMAFLPAIDKIAADYHTSKNMITISNACYCVVMALSPCLMSPLGDIYGRRPLCLICTLGFTISTILVAVSPDLAMFFVFRCVAALFGTAFFSLGGSIISDIYIPQQRGNALGWTLSGSQMGTAFAPVIGGVIVTYTSWRVIFWVLAGLGAFTSLLVFFFLDETIRISQVSQIKKETGARFVFVKYNPFKVVRAFKYTNLILGGFMSMSLLYNMYTLTTTIPSVVNPRFGLTSPVYGALFYLAPGLGYLSGSFFGGRWADYKVRKYMKMRGERIPEDRLRSTYFSFGFVLPASVLIYGWTIEKEVGGMAVPIIALFCNGVAQTVCFPSINAYCVDCLPHLGGDAIASNYFARYIAGAIGTATCLTQINNIGVGWSNTVSFFVLYGGFAACLILIKFGGKLRDGAMKSEEK